MMAIPAALRPGGVDLFCLGKKFLVLNLVSRNLKVKYRRSFFGFFWTLLVPIATAAIYYFTFKVILKVEIPRYLIFILSGVLPWTFFAQTITEGVESLVGNQALITKVPVPLQVFPYVGAVTNFITLLLAFPVIIAAALISGVELNFTLVFLPYFAAVLFLLAYSLSMILAIGYAYFRDLKHIVGVVLHLWFYATPVIYLESMIPDRYQFILILNPVGMLFSGLHDVLVRSQVPDAITLAVPLMWAVGTTLIALALHKTAGTRVVERM